MLEDRHEIKVLGCHHIRAARVRAYDDRALLLFVGIPMFQHHVLSSYALTCALLTIALLYLLYPYEWPSAYQRVLVHRLCFHVTSVSIRIARADALSCVVCHITSTRIILSASLSPRLSLLNYAMPFRFSPFYESCCDSLMNFWFNNMCVFCFFELGPLSSIF